MPKPIEATEAEKHKEAILHAIARVHGATRDSTRLIMSVRYSRQRRG